MSGQNSASNKIAILLPDLRGGGAERISVNLANELHTRGFLVDMVLLQAEGQLLSLLNPGVRVVDLKVLRIRRLLFPLIRYIKESKPDALLACMWPLTLISVAARALSGLRPRLVLAEHTTWSQSQIGGSRLRLGFVGTTMRVSFPLADARVAVSEGAAKDLARLASIPDSSITVIHNPVVGKSSTAVIDEVRPPEGWWLAPGPRVLAVGALRRDKDFPTLLRAFAQLGPDFGARLLILGEGTDRAALHELAVELGIAHAVDMPGFVDDTAPYYKKADLYVLSSTAEGLPTVLIEALATGTRIVSTDCPSGPNEILMGGRFGRLVPVGEVKAIAKAMQKSLAEEPDRGSLMTRARDFSIEKGTDKYLDVMLPEWRQHLPLTQAHKQ